MPFKCSNTYIDEANTVPYEPIHDNIRRNYGFTDLRGRPDKAEQIVEGASSAALRALIVRLASSDSILFSLGCDLGSHPEPAEGSPERQVAGGYIQLTSIHYDKYDTDAFDEFGKALAYNVADRVGDDDWEMKFVGAYVNLVLPGEPHGLYPSWWIWFFAAAPTQAAAIESCERLIGAIDSALKVPSVLSALAS